MIGRLFLAMMLSGCGLETTGENPRPDDARPNPHDTTTLPIDALAAFECRPRITSGLDTGRHNPGQNCQQGCHEHGFRLSGTLFSSIDGGAPVAGATITFIDAMNRTGDMRVNMNGNFWWTIEPAFPVTIIASMCPDVRPMMMQVTAAEAACNQGGCHDSAGNRIHLP